MLTDLYIQASGLQNIQATCHYLGIKIYQIYLRLMMIKTVSVLFVTILKKPPAGFLNMKWGKGHPHVLQVPIEICPCGEVFAVVISMSCFYHCYNDD